MRLPNGYGNISKLSGNRRKPWRVRKTIGWDIVDDTLKQRYINIGYYATRKEAMIALAEYNENPYDIKASKVTLEEIYEKWSAEKYEEVGKSAIIGYKAAWLICEPIKKMKFVDIKIDHLQAVIDKSGKHYHTLRRFRSLIKGLYHYAVVHGVIDQSQDMTSYINIKKAGNPNAQNKNPFSKKEIDKLWSYKGVNEYYGVILILIFTGLRISELLNLKKENVHLNERYFDVVESKTKAGIRSVPINYKIVPLFHYWMNRDCDYFICTPDNEPFNYTNYYDSYWKPFMKELNMKHTPHSTRHTFISLLTAAKIDERFIQKIVGHKGQNVTRQVYTHLEIDELIREVDKI